MKEGNLWRCQRPEAPNPALLLKAFGSPGCVQRELCRSVGLWTAWGDDGSGFTCTQTLCHWDLATIHR